MDDDKMTELLAEQAELQEKIEAGDGWEMDRRIDIALDALRCPPAESPVTRATLQRYPWRGIQPVGTRASTNENCVTT